MAYWNLDIKVIDERLMTEFGGLPTPASAGAAACDLVACAVYEKTPAGKPNIKVRTLLTEELVLDANEVAFIGCGFSIATQEPGCAALLLPRSGKGSSEGLVLANSTGLIDVADYRGEIIAAVLNRNPYREVWIKPGEKIVQMMLVPYWLPKWSTVKELPPSARGAGGFGSTSA